MRKLVIALILMSFCLSSSHAATALGVSDTLSSSAYASILTCGPGDEFYETFGHSALRICDSVNGIDVAFNYGMFSFGEPHFYLKFAKGRLNYFVSAYPFEVFMLEYAHYGRMVFEQRLKLTGEELQKLYESLCTNILPENKYYKYDFFRDNCATRIRDMVEASLIERTFLKESYPLSANTYRDLLHKYIDSTLLWWRLGVDLLLGAKCDVTMKTTEYMYIPMEMMTQYDTTLTADGTTLAEPAIQLLTDKRVPAKKSLSPTLCFWLFFAFVVLLTLFARRNRWKLYWFDGIIYTAVSIVSLLLIYLWFFSDHWCTKDNFNLMWANPLYIWLLVRLRHSDTLVTIIIGLILLTFLVGFAMWPQQINSAVLPIALTLAVRLIDRFTDKKKYIK